MVFIVDGEVKFNVVRVRNLGFLNDVANGEEGVESLGDVPRT